MRHRFALLALSVLAVFVVSSVATPDRPARAEDGDAALRKAVRHIVTKLLTVKTGLRVGQPGREAAAAAKGAAKISGEHVLPLASTPYAPEGDWHGVVKFVVDEPAAPIDGIDVVLLCPDAFDKRTMGRYLVVVGVEHGVKIEPDGEDDRLFWIEEPEARDLYISLGDRVIYFYGCTSD